MPARPQFGDQVAARYKRDGEWRDMTFAQSAARIEELALGLVAVGIAPGDRVAILSNTRLEWTLVSLAASAAGAVVVPVYPTNAPRNASGCSATRARGWWSARTRRRSAKIEQVRAALPALEHVFVIDAADGVPSLDELVARGRRPGPRGAHAPPGRRRDRGHLHDHLHVGHDRPAEGHRADARQRAVGLRQGPSARDHRRGRHALSVPAARACVRAGVAAGRLRAGRDDRLLRRRHPADPAGADRDQADVRAVGAADLREALRRGAEAAGAGLRGGPGAVRQGDRARRRRSAADRSGARRSRRRSSRRSTRPTSACTSGSAACSAASSSRRSPAPPRSRRRSSSSSTPAACR